MQQERQFQKMCQQQVEGEKKPKQELPKSYWNKARMDRWEPSYRIHMAQNRLKDLENRLKKLQEAAKLRMKQQREADYGSAKFIDL